ncbi:hypothetical protein [Pontibacter mangrovi]|uniref:Uncharacterized protein n=1 Tax=Pontibacter mangrovi TaxID=2589816 RepID=A0A501W9K1_9BACT|nr:hypothetical protein [Pontibacter mangrovi]TPE43487.1 hypothetical protein FJM65_12045 [Pontibacter mangrovi]
MIKLALSILLPLTFILPDTSQLQLLQDLKQDLQQLQSGNSHFISDNSTLSPSVETVAQDLQLFGLIAHLDLSQASYTWQEQGQHQVHRWKFDEGDIRSIVEIQSSIPLDTVVTVRYLDGKPPTQQHIANTFTFRAYFISTVDTPNKLYYLTEEEQGLLGYRLGEKLVEVTYASAKKGLSDVLPRYKEEVRQLVLQLQQ